MRIIHRVAGTSRVNSPALLAFLMALPECRRAMFVARLARRLRALGIAP